MGMADSFGQLGTVTNVSDFGSVENNSVITGVTNDQVWDWDDDDRGDGMDIQALLSEFGDFGDFFENDALPFGEVISFLLSISNVTSKIVHAFKILYFLCFLRVSVIKILIPLFQEESFLVMVLHFN